MFPSPAERELKCLTSDRERGSPAAVHSPTPPRRRDNPFHNFRHCFTVAHTAWRFIAHSEHLQQRLETVDYLALLLAALSHDLEHPGTTNAFQARGAGLRAWPSPCRGVCSADVH